MLQDDGQAGVPPSILEADCSEKDFERIQRARDILAQRTHRLDHIFTFKDSLSEQYLKCLCGVAIKFEMTVGGGKSAFWVIRPTYAQSAETGSHCAFGVELLKGEAVIDAEPNHHIQKQMMFVDDIKLMQLVEREITALVGLQVIEDEAQSLDARFLRDFLSAKGTFDRLPILSKWELCVLSYDPFVGLDQPAIYVVQAGSEVVDRVSNHCGGVARRGCSEVGHPVSVLPPFVVVALGENELEVRFDVGPEHGLELVDVVVGPLYL